MGKKIDCITFFDNNFIFDFRYNVMKNYVDKFVICESLYDHRNNKKGVNFDPDKKYINDPQILHIVVEKPFPKNTNAWQNQAIQRDYIIKKLNFAEDNDFIFFSDPDEILNPEVLKNFEPRVRVQQILARPDIDRNAYNLRISFYVVGHPDPVTVETFLERLR